MTESDDLIRRSLLASSHDPHQWHIFIAVPVHPPNPKRAKVIWMRLDENDEVRAKGDIIEMRDDGTVVRLGIAPPTGFTPIPDGAEIIWTRDMVAPCLRLLPDEQETDHD